MTTVVQQVLEPGSLLRPDVRAELEADPRSHFSRLLLGAVRL